MVNNKKRKRSENDNSKKKKFSADQPIAEGQKKWSEQKKKNGTNRGKKNRKKEKSEQIEPVAARCCSVTPFSATNRLRCGDRCYIQ